MFTDRDYAPITCDDPTFYGIATDSTRCVEHKRAPRKVVAFEGSNTGRRFYICSVEDEIQNCGFVKWIDPELTETTQNALRRLWGMHQESRDARIEERIENARLMKELFDEKKKYSELVDNVDRFIKKSSQECMEENYSRIQNEERDGMIRQMRVTIDLLERQVGELKQVQRSQAEVMKSKQQKWDEEKEVLKEEKKKLEHSLFDLFNLNDVHKGKLKRIQGICEEPSCAK